MCVIEFNSDAAIHHKHSVAVHNGVQTMCYCQYGAIGEFLANGFLQEFIGGGILKLQGHMFDYKKERTHCS